MFDKKKLQEEYVSLYAQNQSVSEKYSELSAEDQKAFDDRLSRMEAINKELEAAERFAKLAIEGKQSGKPVANAVVQTARKTVDELAVEQFQSQKNQPIKPEAFATALSEWLQYEEIENSEAYGITTTSNSAAWYPKQVGAPILALTGSALRDGMAAVGAVALYTDSTADLNLPVISIAVGNDIDEDEDAGFDNHDNTPTAERINLKPKNTSSGQVWFSNMELASLDYDMVGAILPALNDAKEMRLEQRAFQAIIDDATLDTVTTATPTTITVANMGALIGNSSKRFDRQKVVFLSRQAYNYLASLTGSDGQLVLTRDPQNQTLLRYQGVPVIKSDFLQPMEDEQVVGICISFVGAKVRDAGPTKVVRYINDKDFEDQTGLSLMQYCVFGYVDDAVCKLVTGGNNSSSSSD